MLYLNIDDHKITALVTSNLATSIPVMLECSVMSDKYSEALAEIAESCRKSHVWPTELNVFICGPVTIAPTEEIISNPEVLFDSCFDFTDKTQRKVYHNEICSLHALLIFGVNTTIIDAISHQFSGCEINYHSSLSPMLTTFSCNYKKENRLRTYLHCREGFIDIFAFDGRCLTIMNSFPVCSVSDAVYYTIALSKSIGIDIRTMPFYVCGDRTMTGELKLSMKQFATTVLDVEFTDALPVDLSHVHQQLPHSIAAHLSCA